MTKVGNMTVFIPSQDFVTQAKALLNLIISIPYYQHDKQTNKRPALDLIVSNLATLSLLSWGVSNTPQPPPTLFIAKQHDDSLQMAKIITLVVYYN